MTRFPCTMGLLLKLATRTPKYKLDDYESNLEVVGNENSHDINLHDGEGAIEGGIKDFVFPLLSPGLKATDT